MNHPLLLFCKKHLKTIIIALFAAATLITVFCLKQLTTFNYTLVTPPILEKSPSLKPAKPTSQKLHEAPIFGSYLIKDHAIPSTVLNLKLLGVLKSTKTSNSQVIIKLNNGKEKIFHLNDFLPGNAKIIKINDTTIILDRNGNIEKLQLDKDKLTFDKPLPPLELNAHE